MKKNILFLFVTFTFTFMKDLKKEEIQDYN
jgi:hypothetical protein